MRVLLVSSAGGVLLDLLALEPWWCNHDVVWAAVQAMDTTSFLGSKRVYWIKDVSIRQPLGMLPALAGAWRILRKERPEVIVSAGAGAALPYFVLARCMGIVSLWLTTFNVLTIPGITGTLCARLASRVLLQHEASLSVHPDGLLIGELY